MKHQRIDKSTRLVAVGGMYHHSLRLVDNDDIPVLIHDVELYILSFSRALDGCGYIKGENVPLLYPILLAIWGGVDKSITALNILCGKRTADAEPLRDNAVKALARLFLRYYILTHRVYPPRTVYCSQRALHQAPYRA